MLFSVGHVFIAKNYDYYCKVYRKRERAHPFGCVVHSPPFELSVAPAIHLCTHNLHLPIVICLAKLFLKLFLLVIAVQILIATQSFIWLLL